MNTLNTEKDFETVLEAKCQEAGLSQVSLLGSLVMKKNGLEITWLETSPGNVSHDELVLRSLVPKAINEYSRDNDVAISEREAVIGHLALTSPTIPSEEIQTMLAGSRISFIFCTRSRDQI